MEDIMTFLSNVGAKNFFKLASEVLHVVSFSQCRLQAFSANMNFDYKLQLKCRHSIHKIQSALHTWKNIVQPLFLDVMFTCIAQMWSWILQHFFWACSFLFFTPVETHSLKPQFNALGMSRKWVEGQKSWKSHTLLNLSPAANKEK